YLHYAATKSAIIGMMRLMARKPGDWNIAMHLFMPGSCYGFVWMIPNLPQSKHLLHMGESLFPCF
ncbi:MAG: hypothetical protein VXY05_02320, partial [Pseudomonadota bacterium]|nr:hypothetical protein [Pseudomonadota bacterium]